MKVMKASKSPMGRNLNEKSSFFATADLYRDSLNSTLKSVTSEMYLDQISKELISQLSTPGENTI